MALMGMIAIISVGAILFYGVRNERIASHVNDPRPPKKTRTVFHGSWPLFVLIEEVPIEEKPVKP